MTTSSMLWCRRACSDPLSLRRSKTPAVAVLEHLAQCRDANSDLQAADSGALDAPAPAGEKC